jgi:hypothetical protein
VAALLVFFALAWVRKFKSILIITDGCAKQFACCFFEKVCAGRVHWALLMR